jgi:hypothetical protein
MERCIFWEDVCVAYGHLRQHIGAANRTSNVTSDSTKYPDEDGSEFSNRTGIHVYNEALRDYTSVSDPKMMAKRRSPKHVADIAQGIGEYCERMNAANFTYWLDRGTLIGAARNGKVIPYDFDGDLATFCDDLPAARKIMDDSFSSFAENAEDAGEGKSKRSLFSFRCKNPYIIHHSGGDHVDMVGLEVKNESDGKEYLVDGYGHAHLGADMHLLHVPVDVLLPLKDCNIEGHRCRCPNDVSAYLSSQYTEDWFLPRQIQGYESYWQEILHDPKSMLSREQKKRLMMGLRNHTQR